ncbi:ABC transporter substrate-binding protein [Labilibacter marinus]|uniref:ABC transporter substrate-binding protein n=1 Tax=Labilibacter marinus TaxID=1477105 RepID=UPI00094FF638|nr:sugar ABC transporter substrate-binding protein [Labilibacter marinus]
MAGKIRIAVRKYDPFERAIDAMWKEFCEINNCHVELEAVPMDLHPLYDATIKNDGLKNGDWDIALMNTDWITEAKSSNIIIDLSQYISKSKPEGYPEGWSESLLEKQQFGDATVGLPFHNGPECLIYRKDLFESEKEKEAFRKVFGKELKLPHTWDDLLEVATFFYRPEQNLYGTSFAAYPDGHNTVFDFCLQLWTRGGELMVDGGVLLNSPQAIEGMEFYRKALKNDKAMHPKSRDFDSVKLGLSFAQGELAMMVNWFGFASNCEVDENSKVAGKVDVANVPAGPSGQEVSLNAYWMYVIGAGSKQKQLAYDFIQFAVSKKNDEGLTLEGGIGCRKSTWHSSIVNEQIPYYHKLEELHSNTRSLPRKENWSQVADVIDQLVLDVINTDESIEEILNKAQEKANKL